MLAEQNEVYDPNLDPKPNSEPALQVRAEAKLEIHKIQIELDAANRTLEKEKLDFEHREVALTPAQPPIQTLILKPNANLRRRCSKPSKLSKVALPGKSNNGASKSSPRTPRSPLHSLLIALT